MDPIFGTIILTAAAQQVLIINPRCKKTSRMMQRASERAAEAELKYKKHWQEAEDAYKVLCTQTTGIAVFLDGTFAEIYKPFESSDAPLLNKLVGWQDSTQALSYIHSVAVKRDFKQFRQLPGYQKQTRAGAAMSFFLFGRMGELMQQKSAAEAQLSVARLIEADCDSLCMALDIQKENYTRVQKTLQALNVALLKTSADVSRGMALLSHMLDGKGHISTSTTLQDLSRAFTPEQIDKIAININIAKCIAAILEEPIFTENAEITQRTRELLEEGQKALSKIQMIRKGGK